MIHVHAAAVRSISSVAVEKHKTNRFKKNDRVKKIIYKVVNAMVELDQMKQELQTYESPLAEVRDSL